jgi:hypothetical protein
VNENGKSIKAKLGGWEAQAQRFCRFNIKPSLWSRNDCDICHLRANRIIILRGKRVSVGQRPDRTRNDDTGDCLQWSDGAGHAEGAERQTRSRRKYNRPQGVQ